MQETFASYAINFKSVQLPVQEQICDIEFFFKIKCVRAQRVQKVKLKKKSVYQLFFLGCI